MTQFDAGKYYIGDPCYVIKPHEEWIKVLEKNDYFREENFTWKKAQCFASGTAWGDGKYQDQDGNKYPVDAGLLGIIPTSVISLSDKIIMNFGNVVEFEKSFEVYESGGVFHFGNILIDTCGDEE